MFDPFRMWDEMLDIYEQTVAKSKDEQPEEYITMEVEIPAHLEDQFVKMIDYWLEENDAR